MSAECPVPSAERTDRRRNPLKDPAPFRAWLEAKGQFAIVGKVRNSCECPLASFIKETRGDSFVRVHEDGFVAGDQSFVLSDWAQAFVRKLDAGHRKNTRVHAAYALVLLGDAVGGS